MNLVWIIVILAALVISTLLVVGSAVVIFRTTRKSSRWIRYALLCVPVLLVYGCWSKWLGPHDLTNPRELEARFELVFGSKLPPMVTDLHYRLNDGPDAMTEWFSFRSDFAVLRRLSPDLRQVQSSALPSVDTGAPAWWPSGMDRSFTFYGGTIPTKPDASPRERKIWIEYDEKSGTAFCFIESML